MGTETNPSLRIPVIHFSTKLLQNNTPEWKSVRAHVIQALEEFGCFEALFDKMSVKLRENEIFEATKELFDLPLEIKQLNVSTKPFYSYRSYGKNTPGGFPHEAFFIEHANINEKVESFTKVSWPQGNPTFWNDKFPLLYHNSQTVYSFSEQVAELDRIIKRMVFESLGIEKYFEEHMESTEHKLRIIKYEHLETDGTKMIGLAAHTDKGYTGILCQNQVDGLEVQTKDGQWISVKPSPSSLVVLLGEAFSHVLTNGRFHCPVHRVMMSGNQPRYSTVLFSHPKDDYLIKTPEDLVDENHPLIYKPFYYPDYVKFFMTTGKAHQSPLHAFCGI